MVAAPSVAVSQQHRELLTASGQDIRSAYFNCGFVLRRIESPHHRGVSEAVIDRFEMVDVDITSRPADYTVWRPPGPFRPPHRMLDGW